MNRSNETVIKKSGKILQVDNAKIRYKNFSGVGTAYNHAGDRNFVWVIEDEDLAEDLKEWGYNVKEKTNRDGDPVWNVTVKVKFNDYGPKIFLLNDGSKKKTLLDADTVGCLDGAFIIQFDMDLRESEWNVNGKSGIALYLNSARAIIEANRFEMDDEDDGPF